MKNDTSIVRKEKNKGDEKKHIVGDVEMITTKKDGRTTVYVEPSKGTDGESFDHPGDMTKEQLEEFKRAQNNGHHVSVKWSTDKDGDKTVEEVTVITRG